MTNDDVVDLYDRAKVGATVVVNHIGSWPLVVHQYWVGLKSVYASGGLRG
jgi:hypothetical protein